MATIHIDGKDYPVDGDDNLLHACLSLGLDVPYFCWHPALGSVGACRQCAVKQFRDENDKQGKLVMSCMTGSADGTYISISDPEAKAFRASIVEWLMTNHPHDCPVCEEGGHCHLQDMTVMTAHSRRRYRFSKRTHQNQDLGPFVAHEMNRCIACYRCTRYYKDYADGKDFGVYGAASNVYFGRPENGAFESEFSGNLTEVCPTGVFTDKTHSDRYNRKWDMQFAPSICQQCAIGCNISPGERYGELRRIENRYNGTVNGYFLCDRGRFGYGYVNRKDRPRQPLALTQGRPSVLSTDNALAQIGETLRHANRILGIGSPRASLEANYALRELVGASNYSCGIAAEELANLRLIASILENGAARTPSLSEVEDADAILILGEDVTQTAPRLALALRQAAKGLARKLAEEKHIAGWQAEAIQNIGRSSKYPVFIASVDVTKLDDTAEAIFRAVPQDLARLGFAVAHAIDASAPGVPELSAAAATIAQRIAEALLASHKPLIVAGTGAGSESLLHAAGNIAQALHAQGKQVSITFALAECNSLGVTMLDAGPVEPMLQALCDGQADALIVLENDLYRRVDAPLVDAALAQVKTVIAIDHQTTPTLLKAHFAFPAASFAEGDGTLISSEGRAQRFFQVYDPAYYEPGCQIREGWRWLHALNAAAHARPISWTQLDHATEELARAVPKLARIADAAPTAGFRMQGLKIAREPHRYSGRTAMRANISVHEPRASQDADTALAFSMEGHNGTQAGDRPGALIPYAWAPGWNSPQAWNKFQDEVGGSVRKGDPGVRLFEPAAAPSLRYFDSIPPVFTAREGEWHVLRLFHALGSEELSARAAPVIPVLPAPYAALSLADAQALGIGLEGGTIDVWLPSVTVRLPVTIHPSLPVGSVGIPSGLPGVPPLPALASVRLSLAAVV